MKRKAFLWVAGAVVIAILVALIFRSSRPVVVIHPAYGPAVQAVYATGTVESEVMLPIAPRIGARIMTLNADEGDAVRKGDVLARLENREMQNTVAQLAAQEEFARNDYRRHAALVRDGVIARQNYDRAKANFEAAHAATEAARAQTAYLTLVAPADGIVIKRDGEVGQFLPVNQPLFWLAKNGPLRISSEVDEEDISLVRPGQKVLVRADAFPDRIFEARVQSVTPKGDPVARSYRVRILPDRKTPLQIGMTAETNIVTREKQKALLAPAEAITDGMAWLVRDGRLAKRKVRTGIKGRNEVEIIEGLGAEDLIVAKPEADLEAGQRVDARISDWP